MDNPSSNQTIKTLYLKNMICRSCMRIINEDLEDIGVHVIEIILGKITIAFDDNLVSFESITTLLENDGFPIVADKERILAEQIKTTVRELILFSLNNTVTRNSDYLVDKLGYSYQHLSTVFSRYENNTLEKFIIALKIEKVKELVEYGELSLSEIAYMLGYSSVQYLSTQFKNTTGISVTDYKSGLLRDRLFIEDL
ncbi:MAG: AraC family transcriptional regulator [Bacteroidota bacterium]